MLQRFGGASIKRVIDRSYACVPEHTHDWPVLSLFVMGDYANDTEAGHLSIYGPSAILYRAGTAHRNVAGCDGFEQIEIEFDPAWLATPMPDDPLMCWIGGEAGREALSLARSCSASMTEQRLLAAVRQFLERRQAQSRRRAVGWTDIVARKLRDDPSLKAGDLAKHVGLHPSWLGSAYRSNAGEGILETAARVRVQHAARLLRESDRTCADIAADAGFCDQSHMNRTFRRTLGRLPTTVRNERILLRSI